MRTSGIFLPIAAAVLLLPVVPMQAHAQDEDSDAASEQDVDELPSYSGQELENGQQGTEQPADPGAIGTWEDAEQQANPGASNYQPAPPAGGEEQAAPQADAGQGSVTFDQFYSDLSSYGTWVETPQYGWVWVPTRQNEVNDWRPYEYGQWAWTNYGWTWASEEPFGWATYHYGRWAHAARWGWYWVPGYTWGPAWVAWRSGPVAVGWAPLYPGYVAWGANYPYYESQWLFVEPSFFYGFPVYRHCYPFGRTAYYYRETNWAGPWRHGATRTVFVGPHRTFIASRSTQGIRTASIQYTSHPVRSAYVAGNKPQLNLYRPAARAVSSAPRGAPRVGSGLTGAQVRSAQTNAGRSSWSGVQRLSPRDVRPPDAPRAVGPLASPSNPNRPGPRAYQPQPGGRFNQAPPAVRPSSPPGPQAPARSQRRAPPVAPPVRPAPPHASMSPGGMPGYASNSPVPRWGPSQTSQGAPRYSAPSMPRYSGPSGPRFSAPSAPHFSAPSAPHFSAPSAPHFSAPSAPHFSAPSAPHFSGSSSHGGGGGGGGHGGGGHGGGHR